MIQSFYNKLQKLNVQAGKEDKILAAHVQCICEAHATVMQSYYQQIHGSSGADATTSRHQELTLVNICRLRITVFCKPQILCAVLY